MKELKIAFVFVGTIIGAGLASGQEILQFFTVYGSKGFLGIILCCIFYIFFSKIIIELSIKFKFKSYKDFMDFIFGRFSLLSDIIYSFFIFASNVIMISGSATMLYEYFHIDKKIAVIFVSLIVLIISLFSTKGIIEFNSLVVPFSTLNILVLGLFVFFTQKNAFYHISSIYKPLKSNWITSSIIYSAFNIMSLVGVFTPMMDEIKNKGAFLKGSIIGSIILTIMASFINFSIMSFYPQSFIKEIPNLYIAKFYGKILPTNLLIAIWLEMISTEISDIYALSNRFKSLLKLSYRKTVFLIIAVSIPFSLISFSKLIRIIYPLYGVISLIFLIISSIKAFLIR
ncbi:Uncharacterized membrane protein YkvI [Caloramator fervidus]|uniref:Uncharacterized membrane protein YkvI n=1 Tax=Caloramator fervidus TaxID=29344 RepID=A0A1H5UVB7_9CLOT|nr:transporter [Caloramator fervidus]SEF79015.1 Uncharacterized membrane protein YkvI [Caloramator fervidus]